MAMGPHDDEIILTLPDRRKNLFHRIAGPDLYIFFIQRALRDLPGYLAQCLSDAVVDGYPGSFNSFFN